MTTKTLLPKNTFNGGQISKDGWGKIESEVYGKSMAKMENFLSNPLGSAIYRNGFKYVATLNTNEVRFEEFKFNNQQSYVVVFTDKKAMFLSYDEKGNFGLVIRDGKPLEVTLPYTYAQIKNFNVAQTGDVMFITDGFHETGRLIRKEANLFVFSYLDTKGLPFGADNSNENIKLTPSATKGDINVTVTGSNNFFQSSDVGRLLSINVPKVVKEDDVQGYVRINKVESPTKAYCTVIKELSSAESTATWARSAFSNRTGYPTACALYESRLWLGGTVEEPTGVWGSVLNEFEKFTDGEKATDSVFFRVAEVSERIKWLMGGANSLLGGTGQGIITMNGGDSVTAITPTSVRAKLANSEGAANIAPAKQNSDVFYIDNHRRRIRVFSYNLLSESFTADDLNVMNYDLTYSKIKKIVYQNDKYSFIWALKENGKLVAITFLNSDGLVVNGGFDVSTQGKYKEIGTITREDGSTALIALVDRGVIRQGIPESYIEILNDYVDYPNQEDFFSDNEQEDKARYKRAVFDRLKYAIHLDSSISYIHQINCPIDQEYDRFSDKYYLTNTQEAFTKEMEGKELWVKPDEEGRGSGKYRVVKFLSSLKMEVEIIQYPDQTVTLPEHWYLTTDEFAGLERFNGKEVRVVADGNDLGNFQIQNGKLKLPNQHSVVHIGYPYTGIMKSLNLGYTIQGISTQLTEKSIVSIILRLFNSWGGECGSDAYNLQEIMEFSNDGNLNDPPMPINADIEKYIEDSYAKKKQYFILQKRALPFNISMLGYNLSQGTR